MPEKEPTEPLDEIALKGRIFEHIRESMIEHRWNDATLARQARVSRGTISNMFSDKRLGLALFVRICDALGLSMHAVTRGPVSESSRAAAGKTRSRRTSGEGSRGAVVLPLTRPSDVCSGVVVRAADGTLLDYDEGARRLLGVLPDGRLRVCAVPGRDAVLPCGALLQPHEHPSAIARATGRDCLGVVIGLRENGVTQWCEWDAHVLPSGAIALRFRELRDLDLASGGGSA